MFKNNKLILYKEWDKYSAIAESLKRQTKPLEEDTDFIELCCIKLVNLPT